MSDQLDLDFTQHPIIEIKSGEVKAGYIAPIKKRGRPPGSKNKKNQAGVAPIVEQEFCKLQDAGANPVSGSISEDRFSKLKETQYIEHPILELAVLKGN